MYLNIRARPHKSHNGECSSHELLESKRLLRQQMSKKQRCHTHDLLISPSLGSDRLENVAVAEQRLLRARLCVYTILPIGSYLVFAVFEQLRGTFGILLDWRLLGSEAFAVSKHQRLRKRTCLRHGHPKLDPHALHSDANKRCAVLAYAPVKPFRTRRVRAEPLARQANSSRSTSFEADEGESWTISDSV